MPAGYKAEFSSWLLKRNLCPQGINGDSQKEQKLFDDFSEKKN